MQLSHADGTLVHSNHPNALAPEGYQRVQPIIPSSGAHSMSERVAEIPIRLSVWDRAGLWLSGICIVHCLALPLVLIAIPLWPALEPAHDWIHPAFAALLIGTTLPAAFSALKRHRSPKIAALLIGGLSVVMLAMLAGDYAGIYAEDGITLLGSGLLVAGHWKNGRACARGTCVH